MEYKIGEAFWDLLPPLKDFQMITRYSISDSLQELAIVEFSDGNIEFQKVLFPKF